MAGYPGRCGAPHQTPFLPRDRLEWVLRTAAPRLHLDEGNDISFDGDDIEFSVASPPVPIENLEAVRSKVGHRELFAGRGNPTGVGCATLRPPQEKGLGAGYRGRDDGLHQVSTDSAGDQPELADQRLELRRRERLRSIGYRIGRARMDL